MVTVYVVTEVDVIGPGVIVFVGVEVNFWVNVMETVRAYEVVLAGLTDVDVYLVVHRLWVLYT